ncbi:MAG: UvrD-helicase domain-containing protein [Candidatus Hydrogenedentes bacterium]|nr:UvrD-helicase domain-containing protein [Candidatus Hydrogenedentota bacterium]
MKPTPEQQAAIEAADEHLCVDAGAGAGKTGVLIERVLFLLEAREVPLERIVAITFTDKASGEMKQRLRKRFRERAPLDDPARMNLWRGLEQRIESARILTIHTFCAGILRENALWLGMDPDFRILPEEETLLLRKEIVRTTVHDLLEGGHPAAVRVATEYGVSAVARCISELLRHRGMVEQVLSVLPTQSAEKLLESWQTGRQIELTNFQRSGRLQQFRNELASFEGRCKKATDGREVLRIETISGLDRMIAASEMAELGFEIARIATLTVGSTRVSNWDSQETFVRLKAIQEDLKKELMELGRAGDVADAAMTAHATRLTCDFAAVYVAVADAFQESKFDRNGLDFDDLILKTLRILRENTEARDRIAKGISYLLIDEFQDTDSRQFELARLLSEAPGGPKLFVVGDAKQSIYGFRNAEVEVFGRARELARQVVPLRKNFRSVPEMLCFVDEFFGKSGLLTAVEPEYRPLVSDRASVTSGPIEFLIPNEEEKASLEEYRRKEAEMLARRLVQMCTGSDAVPVYDSERETTRLASFGDVGILFRSMSNVPIYERSLRRLDIPYTVEAGAGFYERQEVLDIRNLLTVLVDPWDEMALVGFLRSPMGGLSDESLIRLRVSGTLVRVFDSPGLLRGLDSVQSERLTRARELVAMLRARCEWPLPKLLRYMFQETGYEAVALSQFLGVQKASNVRKILDLAERFGAVSAPTLRAFTRFLDEVSAEEIREGEATLHAEASDVVKILTVHKAKGLEFPIVAIPDLGRTPRPRDGAPVLVHPELGMVARMVNDEGEWAEPDAYRRISRAQVRKDMEEEARILYVAMTRARDWLLLSGAPTDSDRNASWIHALNQHFKLTSRPDGNEITGAGWHAVVRRAVNKPGRLDTPAESVELPAPAVLLGRIAPARDVKFQRTTYAVTELLEIMVPSEPAIVPDRVSGESHHGRSLDPVRWGTLVHRMLERWDFRSPVRPLIKNLLRGEIDSFSCVEAMEQDLAAVADQFRLSAAGRRIGEAKDVAREMPFLLRIGEVLISGTIDVLLDDGTIVDYKSGRGSPASHARYETQVQLYAAAVRQLLRKTPPAGLIYYVDRHEVCGVDITADGLDAVLARASDAVACRASGRTDVVAAR